MSPLGATTLLHRLLILSHRYLGIALSLMFVVWFASGIVMIYAGGMPRLTPQLRLERLPELDLAAVKLSPQAAAATLAEAAGPGEPLLTTVLERPAYRFPGEDGATVFADTGERLEPLDAQRAREVAARFAGVPPAQLELLGTLLRPDQWTLQRSRDLPLHRFRVADDAATELYVAQRTGEVALLTTRATRALAWVGVIPHWLYFTALRTNQPAWYRTVVWLSALGCVLAVLGLVLGVTQLDKRVRPFRLARAIPYRRWPRWHYIAGALSGVFVLTWVFSGLLSMEPFAWTNARGIEIPREAMSGGPVDLAAFDGIVAAGGALAPQGRALKEVRFARIHDAHWYDVTSIAKPSGAATGAERLHQPYPIVGRIAGERALVDARTLQPRAQPFDGEAIVQRIAAAAAPSAKVAGQALLQEYDSYYYSRGGQLPLPVLRVQLDDPLRSWVYVDPRTSEILTEVNRWSRLERWLYNGLHSLDFSFWYGRRPLWDIGMILLCLGGLATSALGLYLGVKRAIADVRGLRLRIRAPRGVPGARAHRVP